MDALIFVLQLVIAGALWALFAWARHWVPAYMAEKGKTFATKSDIAEVTRTVKTVEAELSGQSAIAEQKRKLKYETYLEALTVIDAHLAQFHAVLGTVLQPIETKKVREVHSKLILCCDDLRVVETFSEIYFGPPPDEVPKRDIFEALREFRNLVRVELGFGDALDSQHLRSWVGKSFSDPAAHIAMQPHPPSINTIEVRHSPTEAPVFTSPVLPA